MSIARSFSEFGMESRNGNYKNSIMSLGLVQMDCHLGDIKANIHKIIEIIDENRKKVDMLVFPELTTTGYCVGNRFHEYALRVDDDLFEKIVEATKNIDVAVGFIEETASFRFYNSLAFISNREIRYIHRKINLPNYGIFEEKKYFSIGPKVRNVDIPPFRIAPFICGDAWSPALVHLGAADEANIFLFSVCSPEAGLGSRLSTKENWKRLNRFYSAIYGAYVIFVNRTGKEHDLVFWGESELIDPFGQVVVASEGAEEKVLIANVDLKEVRSARTTLHTLRDEDLSFIQRRMNQIIQQIDYL